MSNEAYSLGSVNVDSLKEALLFLAQVYPFVDETAKDAFTNQVNGMDSAGNPHESATVDPIPNLPTETPETPAEDSAEGTEEAIPVTDATGETTVATPEGASIPQATAESPAPEMSANDRIAELEAQLADAKAAASQTPPEAS